MIKEELDGGLLNESGLSRLNQIFNGQVDSVNTVAIMSPENPMKQPLPPNENKSRIAIFRRELTACTFGYVQIDGVYSAKENSFVIMNITREVAVSLGKKYEQESILWGEKQVNGDDIAFLFEYINGDKTDDTSGKPTQIDPLPPFETDPRWPFQIDPLIPAETDHLKKGIKEQLFL